jgi:hypothetical protein
LALAVAYANSGDVSKAQRERDLVLRTFPGMTVAHLQSKRAAGQPEYRRLRELYWYSGMRKAGFAEN